MRLIFHRYILPTLLPFLAAVTSLVAGASAYPGKVYWSLGTVLFVTAAAALSSRNNRLADTATEAAVEAKAQLATALTGAGQPLITVLAELSAAGRFGYREKIAVLQDRVVGIAKVQCGRTVAKNSSDHVRAVFYEFDPANRNRLVRKKFEGRNGLTPRLDFVAGRSRQDDGVVGLAQAENSLLVADIYVDAPAYLDRNGRSFRSLISIPVQAGGKSFGLFAVDSSEPGIFNDIDVRYATLLAGLLACGLALADHFGVVAGEAVS